MGGKIVVVKKPIRAAAPVFGQELEPGIEQVCQETLAALYPLSEVAARRDRRISPGRQRENQDPKDQKKALSAELHALSCEHTENGASRFTASGTGEMRPHYSHNACLNRAKIFSAFRWQIRSSTSSGRCKPVIFHRP